MITHITNSKHPDLLSIEFMLGNLCNYRCSYCFPGSNTGDYPWPDVDLLIKNLDHLIARYKAYGKTKFEFFMIGGEPTLWKDLPKLCKHLKDNHDVTIRISTNASRNITWWENNAKYFDRIEISVHHEYANISKIIEIADMLYTKKINVVTNVLMNPYHFEECVNILNQLKESKKRWPIIANAVNYNGETRYNDAQKKYVSTPLKRWPNLIWWLLLKNKEYRKIWVVEDGKKFRVQDNWFILHGKNKFKGWTCNLGVEHIEISKDGIISGTCKEKVYGENRYHNIYSSDFTSTFDPVIKPITCQKDLCHCGTEIEIVKFIPRH